MMFHEERPKVLVIGAGPAGIFAAMQLVSTADVILVDKGKDINERDHDAAADLSSGIGGAGLYSDGKLCLDLRVGGYLARRLTNDERLDLEHEIEMVFLKAMPDLEKSKSLGQKNDRYTDIENSSLQTKSYPVYSIGTDRGAILIRSLIKQLKGSGVTILSNTELKGITKTKSGFKSTLKGNAGTFNIESSYVVLAMGKIGSNQQRAICSSMGIDAVENPMNVGVRFETDAAVLSDFFEVDADPKIRLNFPDGTYVKTHCASNNGAVVPVEYGDYLLAGGHQYHDIKTGRSGFSLVWNGLFNRNKYSSTDTAIEILETINKYVGKSLIVQKVTDFMHHRTSSNNDLAHISLSCRDAKPSNFWEVFPSDVCEAILAILVEFSRLTPFMINDNSVLYGPVIEWWMSTIATNNKSMQTSVERLYVAGDGSGWSQGIVHSAATGLLAGKAIASEILAG